MITAELKGLLTNKLGLIVIVLSIIWALFDMGRFVTNVSHNKDNKLINTTEISSLAIPTLMSKDIIALQSLYNRYIKQGKEVVEVTGMSALEQSKQQGALTALFIDDNKLAIKAVIRNNKLPLIKLEQDNSANQSGLSALLSIVNVKTGMTEIKKFAQGSDVYGYQLSIEKNTQVILTKQITKQNKQSQQQIILTMYKSHLTNDKNIK